MVPLQNWSPHALDALFGIVQDATANPKARKSAALKIAEFLLPKIGKKAKIIPDEYGFTINPNLASAYRDIKFELWALKREPTRKIPAIAEEIKKLQTRSTAILRRLEMPWPTKYGDKEADNDIDRLMELSALRGDGAALTEVQKAEEAHLWARYDVFRASPESIARGRRAGLQDADQRFKMSRLTGKYAPPLSAKERTELNFLRLLYPEPHPHQPDGLEPYPYHPFEHELPASDGIFYPLHSLLRLAGAGDERKWIEQLGEIDPKDITLKEDARDQQNPELLSKCRIRDMEERRAVGFELTATEERELRDLRQRFPEFAAVMDLMDFQYLYEWRREVDRARRAGLSTFAMCEQADIVCLRLRDQTKFTTESDAEEYRRLRSGEVTGAAAM